VVDALTVDRLFQGNCNFSPGINSMQPLTRSIRWHLILVLLSAILLNSCAVSPPEQPEVTPAPAAAQASYPPDLQGAQLYRIDAAASSVHILAYRGGTMARMGHNHVISSTNFSGFIWRGSTLQGSGFNIVVPVNDLIVDDDEARKAEGAEFPLNIDDEARQGTRKNMLSEQVLDGAHFRSITIKSVAMTGTLDAPQVRAALQIKQQTREVTVPVTIEDGGTQLTVRGEFKFLQSDFGIVPFSVGMGTLYVVDSVTIRFDLVGRHAEP
jgi:polyisoprenoid-binding protein YceI